MAIVYLHIGLPKTGTTALQNFLTQNDAVLKKHGICYPDFGIRYPGIGSRRNAHFLTAPWRDADGNPDYGRPGNAYESTLDQVKELARKYDKIFLTDESIWCGSSHRENFWPQLKKDLDKRDLELKIIVYLRRQDEWVQSYWGQKVREGTDMPFPKYIRRMEKTDYPLDYCAQLDLLAEVWGKDALIVRVYEREQYQGEEHTIFSDFLNIFGLSMKDGFVMQQDIYNNSLEGDYRELWRMLNRIPEFSDDGDLLKSAIDETQHTASADGNLTKYSWFKPGQQSAFMEEYAASNRRLAEKYLGREDGVLFYQEAKTLPQWESDDGELLRDMVLVYGRALCALEQENRAVKQQIKELRSMREDLLWYRLKQRFCHLFGK